MRGDAAPFPGHPKRPYSDDDLAEKLRENMRPFAGKPACEKLVAFLDSIDRTSSVRDLAALLAFDVGADINGLPRNSNIGKSA